MNIMGTIIIILAFFLIISIWYYVIKSFIDDFKELKKQLKEKPVSKKRRLW